MRPPTRTLLGTVALFVAFALFNAATPTAMPTPSLTIAGFLGSTTLSLYVLANQGPPGVDTKLDVVTGTTMTFVAVGQATYGSEGQAGCSGQPLTGPDGHRTVNGKSCAPKGDSNAVLPSVPIGALIGCITIHNACATKYFAIGAIKSLKATSSGRLYILYNDVNGQYGDNSGGYSVTVSANPRLLPTPNPTTSAYAHAVLADHPVVYYRLDERLGRIAHDSSGNHIDATYGKKTRLGVAGGIRGPGSRVDPAAYSPAGNTLARTSVQSDKKLPSFRFAYSSPVPPHSIVVMRRRP